MNFNIENREKKIIEMRMRTSSIASNRVYLKFYNKSFDKLKLNIDNELYISISEKKRINSLKWYQENVQLSARHFKCCGTAGL